MKISLFLAYFFGWGFEIIFLGVLGFRYFPDYYCRGGFWVLLFIEAKLSESNHEERSLLFNSLFIW